MANIGIGDPAPNFELPDERGRPWILGDHLRVGPALPIFYRGDW